MRSDRETMTTGGGLPTLQSRPSLGTPDLDRVRRVGVRLSSAFEDLISSFPGHAKAVAAMTRWLEIGRAPCQRILLGVRAKQDSLRVIERFPGLAGLETFLEAAERKGADSQLVARARAAIDDYAALIGEAGGSQRRLVEQISAHRDQGEVARPATETTATIKPVVRETGEALSHDEARRLIYEGTRRVTGLASAARVEIRFLRRLPDNPDFVERLMGFAHIGVEAAVNSMPIIRTTKYRVEDEEALTAELRETAEMQSEPPEGLDREVMLEEFCTKPLPIVTARNSQNHVIRVFNPDGGLDHPVDIVGAAVTSPICPHPRTLEPPVYSDNTTNRFPTRLLLLDFYLERSLAAQNIPSAQVIRTGVALYREAATDDLWYDRLPSEPIVIHLGPAVGQRSCSAYPRHRELTHHILERAGWTDTEFIGYRLMVEYPIWQAAYCLSFDFEEQA